MNAHIIARVLLVDSASLIAVLLVVEEFDAHQWKCGRFINALASFFHMVLLRTRSL